jgi:uncharacterized membrane protein
MSFLLVVEWIAVFSTGLIAGILFGDRAGNTYARRRLAPDAFISFQREQNRRFAAMMPLPILAAVVASSAWLVLLRDRFATPEFALAAAGTTCLILAVVMTRAVNIPINDRIDAATGPPRDLEKIWTRWERVHTVRTGFALLAFACELAALAMGRG